MTTLNSPSFSKTAFALLMLLGWAPLGLLAQSGSDAPKDTKNLKERHYAQQKAYEGNQQAFSPPRKNRWSIGIQKGLSFVSGDVRADRGLAIGINARKALGHVFSIRGAISTGYARGQNWRPNGGFIHNSGLNGVSDPTANYTSASYPFVFYNYRMRYWDAGLQGVFNLGNLAFHNPNPKVSIYGFAGPGLMLYTTDLDALDENGELYDYSGIPSSQNITIKQDALNSLRNLMDGEYETPAESYAYKSTFRGRTVLPTIQFGGGLGVKLSNRVDLSLEHRITWTNDDLLDGQRWEESLTLTSSADYHHFTSLGLNFRIGKNREESLWWSNPLAEPLGEIRALKQAASGEVADSDGDGVPNGKDLEPGTPEGVLVDGRGRAIDTDGDGLQDFRDKEPFSPKGAQVDAAGVALDSDRDGVIDLFDLELDTAEGAQVDARGRTIQAAAPAGPAYDMPLPMIHFELGKAEVKQEFYPDLLRVSRFMEANPEVKLNIIGHADVRGAGDKNIKLSQRRAENVKHVLTKSFGIDPYRLPLDYKGSESLLVPGLPGVYQEENEPLHYLNRRVEFSIVE